MALKQRTNGRAPSRTCMFIAVDMLYVMQFGNYLAGPGFPSGHNIVNYAFFDFTDLPGYADLRPVLGTCFNTKSSEALSSMESLVDVCALAQGTCCFNFVQNEIAQVGKFVVHRHSSFGEQLYSQQRSHVSYILTLLCI